MSDERRDDRPGEGGRAADAAGRERAAREPRELRSEPDHQQPEPLAGPLPTARSAELLPAPSVAQVREEDLEPHAGLRYIAGLFKGLAVLIGMMLIAEVAIGLQQDGTAALGLLLLQATRLVVIAAFLWGAGDISLMLIESNHDLRASRILLGRVHAKLETLVAGGGGAGVVDHDATTSGRAPAGGEPASPRQPAPHNERTD